VQKDFAMSRSSCFFMLLLLPVWPAHAELQSGPPTGLENRSPPVHGDLEAFFEFHTDSASRDFGAGKARGETARVLGVECGVLTDTAPVAQWIARPPPKGQVAGSIPARGTNSLVGKRPVRDARHRGTVSVR
jgi:hypothetical protein